MRKRRKNNLGSILARIGIFFVVLLAVGAPAPAEERQPMESALPWLARNPDTIGWLRIGKIIDTPVVQRDNEFYLQHNFDGVRASGGMVFLDEDCSILPRNDHLVLYGHNMRNGTVFGELDRFRDLNYLKKNCIITFDTIYQEAQYVVIGVFDISAETEDPDYKEMLIFNFNDEVEGEGFWDFVGDAQERSFYEIPVDIRPGDKLVSLITCSYSLYDGRLIILMREVRPDEDPEEIAEEMQLTVMK